MRVRGQRVVATWARCTELYCIYEVFSPKSRSSFFYFGFLFYSTYWQLIFLWGVENHQSIVSRPLASATYQRDYGGKRWLANPTSDSGPDYWLQCCGAGRAELIFETWSRSQNYFYKKYLLQSVLRMLHRMKKSSIETYLFVLLLLYRFKVIYGRSWSLSRNYGQRWSRKEPEPIINNFGSATLPYWKFQTWLLFNVIINHCCGRSRPFKNGAGAKNGWRLRIRFHPKKPKNTSKLAILKTAIFDKFWLNKIASTGTWACSEAYLYPYGKNLLEILNFTFTLGAGVRTATLWIRIRIRIQTVENRIKRQKVQDRRFR